MGRKQAPSCTVNLDITIVFTETNIVDKNTLDWNAEVRSKTTNAFIRYPGSTAHWMSEFIRSLVLQ